jgi:hypothetical protein
MLSVERMLHLRLLGSSRRLVRLGLSVDQAVRELQSITSDPRLIRLAVRAALARPQSNQDEALEGRSASDLLAAAATAAPEHMKRNGGPAPERQSLV